MKMRIKRNAALCLVWLVFVLSLPIYVLWTVFYALWATLLAVFNYDHLCLWAEKFCDFIDKVIIQKQWKQRKKK
jgi:hypothetical protein|nr:MAG TPA_asm: hypothetical protein [Caudoviricetes sp.]